MKQIGILCILSLFMAIPSVAQENEKPNIIFILMDDMGVGDVGVYFQNLRKQQNNRSEPWLETPNLDKMASSGAMLTDHYVGAPVCAPSRGSLLTGLSQGHANIRNNQFDKAIADDFTLGNVMQKAGYTTAAFGKWGTQGKGTVYPDWPAHPLKRGFDYYYGYISHKAGHEHYPKEGVHRHKADVWENYTNVVEDLDKCYTGDLWTAAAKRWIIDYEKKENQNPFFMYLAYDTPHAVWELPTSAYPKGGGLNGGMQWIGKPGNMITSAKGKVDSWVNPLYKNQTWDDDKNPNTPEVPWPDSYKRYATSITRIDEQVGDIIQLTKDLGIAENTIIVFTSDNGPSEASYLSIKKYGGKTPDFFNSFGPYEGIKRDVWQGGVVVPTFVLWPGKVPENTKVSAPSAFYDWLPTLVDAAGLPTPAFTNGSSFLPLLKQEKNQDDRTVYIEYLNSGKTPNYDDFDASHKGRKRGQMQLLRKGDILAIRYNIKKAGDDFEIYDITKDPKQLNNLAKTEDLKELQKTLKQEVIKMRMPDEAAPRPYDQIGINSTIDASSAESGVQWSFYEGSFPWLVNASTNATDSGKAAQINQIKVGKNKEGTVYLEGYINAPKNGKYQFSVPANQQIILKVYQANVINNDYRANKTGKVTGAIKLKKGLHPFKIYLSKEKGQTIDLSNLKWALPKSDKAKPFKPYQG